MANTTGAIPQATQPAVERAETPQSRLDADDAQSCGAPVGVGGPDALLRHPSISAIAAFDHVAVPCERPREVIAFYRKLGFGTPDLEQWLARDELFFAVHFGTSKINFHAPRLWQDAGFTLRGPTARPGCGDFCFVWSGSADALSQLLEGAGAEVIEGPVERVGARGKGCSVYTRDPDGNLLEFIRY